MNYPNQLQIRFVLCAVAVRPQNRSCDAPTPERKSDGVARDVDSRLIEDHFSWC